MTKVVSRLFPSVPQKIIKQVSANLEKACLEKSKTIEGFLKDFKEHPAGVFYRSVADIRAESSRLNYLGSIKNCSASVITSGKKTQSVFRPDSTPVIGLLLHKDVPVKAISKQLFVQTPQGQNDKDIDSIRRSIVKDIKTGVDNHHNQQPSFFYMPRQSGVNEAQIDYTHENIAAYALPIDLSDALNCDFYEKAIHSKWFDKSQMTETGKKEKVNLRHMQQLSRKADPSSAESFKTTANELKIIAQLAYTVSKLGPRPIIAFNRGKLESIELSAKQWEKLISLVNLLAEHEYLNKIKNDPSDGDRSIATSLTTAVGQLNALDKTIDPESVKHIAGSASSLPYDALSYIYSKFKS